MITTQEIRSINGYFRIIGSNAFCITIQSRNTKHFWHIVEQQYNKCRSFSVSHKHNVHDTYHNHGHYKTLDLVVSEIKNHDAFQLRGRKNK